VALNHPPNPLAEENGSALIEMAVTFPALFALFFCFMEMCLAFYSHEIISEIAREGARYAMVHGASCPTAATHTCEASNTQVNTWVSGLDTPNIGGGTITVATCFIPAAGGACSTAGSEAVGNTVQVKVTYTFPIKMPFVPTNSISMSSTSEATIIQ
jgi:Flp pilus assembly protein TadG